MLIYSWNKQSLTTQIIAMMRLSSPPLLYLAIQFRTDIKLYSEKEVDERLASIRGDHRFNSFAGIRPGNDVKW